ncbi:hypothetical protein AB833_21995 [Chromatiales bacterium (ex Bugula neritina AB1)]|nr:hypothetical protein AB833_21995 [Chromatiales bacterium (ex Bugula neritina AB1)]
MIARNEENNILASLNSARDCVDHMVVVDTGSTDNTAKLATEAGATVIHHTWADNFAAARNAAVEQVSEGFVLILDADEQLGPGAREAIRKAVDNGNIDGARLPLYNATTLEATHYDVISGEALMGPPTLLERLLRKTDDLKWQGIIHEHVTDWYEKGRNIISIDAPIIHYGAIPEIREGLEKSSRNLNLLEKMCREEDNNPTNLTYYAQELMAAGHFDDAGRIISKAWQIIERYSVSRTRIPVAIPAATLHIGFLLHAERYSEAHKALARALDLAGNHPNLHLLAATVLQSVWQSMSEDNKDDSLLELAVTECLSCRKYTGQPLIAPSVPGADSWAASARIGTIRLLQKEFKLAEVEFELVLKHNPGHLEAILGRAEAHIFTQRAECAMRDLIPLLHPKLADSWILAALASYQFSEIDDILPMLEEGRKAADQHGLMSTHRLSILTSLESARILCNAA